MCILDVGGMEADEKWSLVGRMSRLLSEGSCSDVEFLVGEDPSLERYRAHRVVLAAGSDVFRTMFFGPIPEKSPVRVPDVTSTGFDILLRFLYSDSVTFRDASEALAAAYAAKKYMVGVLLSACERHLLDNFDPSPESVVDALEASLFLGMRRLRDRCLRHVSRHARPFLRSGALRAASRDALRCVLGLRAMHIESEAEVVEAVWDWGRSLCEEEGVVASPEEVRRRTGDLLRHVRFLTLTADELPDLLSRCRILDEKEEEELLREARAPAHVSPESRTRSILEGSRVPFPGEYRYDGSLTPSLIEGEQLKAEITVTGSPVTVAGVVVAFRPIPFYSPSNRSLEVDVRCATSTARCRFRADGEGVEERRGRLLLDSYVVVEERASAPLTVTVSGEGVRLMESRDFSFDLGESEVSVRFDSCRSSPVKELVLVEDVATCKDS